MIAPPINPSDIPNAFPIPSNAIPIVAMVDQELPDAKETMAQIIQVATRNIFGFRIVSRNKSWQGRYR